MLILMAISPIVSSVSASEPPDGGASITITGEHVWNQDDTLNGNVIVSSGATLTIQQTELTVSTGSQILVEEGGTLDLDGGSLIAENTETGYQWMRNNDEGFRSRILVEAGNGDPSVSIPGFTIKISAKDGTFLDGFNAISIGENGTETSTAMSGTQHNITFEEGSVEQWIEFTGIQSLNLVLASSFEMIYDDGSPSDTIQIMDIMHENWMVNAEPEFEIDVQGTLTADEWENYGCKITGAEIMVSGSIDMDKCELIQSTPIIAENSASVKFGHTNLYDSRDDHHVTAGIYTNLDINGNGTDQTKVRGTLVDFWERQLNQQIQFRANEVMASITDFGYPPETTNPIPVDETGLMTLPKRTVEIGFSDGTIWNEQATIVINSYKTAWNAQLSPYGSNEPLPIESLTNYTSSNLPILSIDSIIPEQETNSVDSRIKMNATVTNSGGGDARIALECFLGNGSVADVGGYPILEIPGGETRSVEFNWNMFEPGNTTISCGVIQPSQLVIAGSYGGEPVDSEVVMWTAAIQQESGLGVLPIIVVVFILLVGAGIWILQVSISSEKEEQEQKLRRLDEDEEISE